jgi:2-oxoglutarate ferredoxin oxidoreductase subunit alpha
MSTLSIAITGAGGAGVISCGDLLLRAWASGGGRGLLRKAFGPQIRGGEAASLLKLTADEHYTAAETFDLLVALDWLNFDRFQDEIRLSPGATVLCETIAGMPESLSGFAAREISFSGLATSAHPDGRANMVALGLLGRALELPVDALLALAEVHLAGKPETYRDAAAACVRTGFDEQLELPAAPPPRGSDERWCLSGNQAAAYGALHAGVRFVAAYPITPASDLLEWMASPLEALGGELVQAEDELAAINMALGAAFGGVIAFTATSGPGLALMSESIGLAVAAEVPVCVFNVQRGGPSTGIPTKSEQSDLDIALHGLHGDAPHLVLAPLGIGDCVFTAGWAVNLAQALQTPAIVLSDQFTGQSTAVIEPPRTAPPASPAQQPPETEYLRYRLTESGISTMAVPGDPGDRYTADGLEHNERGTPSAGSEDHLRQLEKRRNKLTQYEFGDDWAMYSGDGEIALVTFGSSAAVIEAASVLAAESGVAVRSVALRLLAPLPVEKLEAVIAGCRRVLVVEQNHSGQLYRYLRSQLSATVPLESYARPGPIPLFPNEVLDQLKEGT